ncbi:TPA: hypothetical protein ACIBRT_003774 [Salmonella enterica subsp. enterica serovar Aberdeen]
MEFTNGMALEIVRMFAKLDQRIEALEDLAAEYESELKQDEYEAAVNEAQKSAALQRLEYMNECLKPILEPVFKELPDPIRCAYRSNDDADSFRAELIFRDNEEYQLVRNLIERYNNGEIA